MAPRMSVCRRLLNLSEALWVIQGDCDAFSMYEAHVCGGACPGGNVYVSYAGLEIMVSE